MATFDQRGQHVNNQYIAAGNINIGAVQNRQELAAELEKLMSELRSARDGGAVDEETAEDAGSQLSRAVEHLGTPDADPGRVARYIGNAKDLLSRGAATAASVAGLVNALDKLLELARHVH